MMSKEKREYTNFKVSTRPSYPELGISKERIRELQSGCRVGKYSSEMLSKACAGFEFIKPWILLSVTKSKSYDLMEYSELGRIPVGRSDFYGFRRKFYHNLDCLLKNGQDDLPMKERTMKKVNSRQKGAGGERELSRILQEHGYNCRRGQQYCGANGDADVVGLPGVHIECKRAERLNISEAIKQAVKDSAAAEVPAVFHWKNRAEWLVTMRLDDWIKMYATSKIASDASTNSGK